MNADISAEICFSCLLLKNYSIRHIYLSGPMDGGTTFLSRVSCRWVERRFPLEASTWTVLCDLGVSVHEVSLLLTRPLSPG